MKNTINEKMVDHSVYKRFTKSFISGLISVFLLGSLFFLSCGCATAMDYYVATWGDNDGPGTYSSPFESVSYAVTKAYPGDNIYIRSGTWYDEHIVFYRSGTQSAPIRLIGLGNVVLDGLDDSGNGIYSYDLSNVEISGIDFRNYDVGMHFDGSSSNLDVHHFNMADMGRGGVIFFRNGNYDARVTDVSIHDFSMNGIGNDVEWLRSCIQHEYGFIGSRNVEIYNFVIRDSASEAMSFRYISNLHIHDGQIYNIGKNAGVDGINFGDNVNNSIIENVDINNTSWHGIALQENCFPAEDAHALYNNIIRNVSVGYPVHNAIDLHTGAVNTTIADVVLYGEPGNLSAIQYQFNGTDLHLSNVTVTGNLRHGLYLYQPNVDAYGCNIYNTYKEPVHIGAANIELYKCNISDDGIYSILVTPEGKDFLIDSCSIGEDRQVHVTADGVIRDMVDLHYSVEGKNGAIVDVEYTDGVVFSLFGEYDYSVSSPVCYSDKSISHDISSLSSVVTVEAYPMYAHPESGYAKIAVNRFDTSLGPGRTLVDVTVYSTDGGPLELEIETLRPGHSYQLYKNDIPVKILDADVSGKIVFTSLVQSGDRFVLEEPSSSANPPIAIAGSDQEVSPGDTVYVDGSASFDNLGIVSYSWDFDSSDGISVDATGMKAEHVYEKEGIYTVTLEVVDADGYQDTDTLLITVDSVVVNPGNHAPHLETIGDQVAYCEYPISFDINATDVDEDQLYYSLSGLPWSANYKIGTNGDFSWTPLSGHAGTYQVLFTVSDGSLVDSETVTISVLKEEPSYIEEEENKPPLMQSIGPKSVYRDEPINFEVTASDPDGDTLVYSVSGMPWSADYVFDGLTGHFSWTPLESHAGLHELTFTVSDGSLTDSQIMTIEVLDITVPSENHAPLLAPITSKTLNLGNSVSFVVKGNDEDGDPLVYSVAGLDIGSGYTFDTSSGYFFWTPQYEHRGVHELTFSAFDGHLSSSQTMSIEVLEGVFPVSNSAPVLGTIGSQIAYCDYPFSLDISAIDPDGDALEYSVSGLPWSAVYSLDNRGTFSWTPSSGYAGTYELLFKVSDGSLSDMRTVTLRVLKEDPPVVQEQNSAPVVQSIGSKSIYRDEALSFKISAVDPDGDALEYSVSGLPWNAAYSLDNTGLFSWTPSEGHVGKYYATFTVSDGVLSDSEAVQITVLDVVNSAPVISPVSPRSVPIDHTLSFTVNAEDPDGDALEYSVSGLPWSADYSLDNTGLFSWTPSAGHAGTYYTTFSVSDGTKSDSVIVKISVYLSNRAPVIDDIQSVTVYSNQEFFFTVSAVDPDGDTLEYSVSGLPWSADYELNPKTGDFSWTPLDGHAGTYYIPFSASDGSLKDTATLVLRVIRA